MARHVHQLTLNELRATSVRIDERCLETADWVLFQHYVSNDVIKTEIKMDRLAMKAEAEIRANEAAEKAAADEVTAAAANKDGRTIDVESKPVENSGTGTSNTSPPPQGETRPASTNASKKGKGNDTGTSPKKKGNAIGDGHGKTGASAFTRATNIYHALKGIIGQLCAKCGEAKMTRHRQLVHIKIVGQPFFGAECHHAEQARCKACGRVVSALPAHATDGLGKAVTWDWSAAALLIVMHYFYAIPFKRIEILHKSWGIPLADATQWEIARESMALGTPLLDGLTEWAIKNMTSFSMDDTGSIILTLKRQIADELKAAKAVGIPEDSIRTGINASGFYIVTPKGVLVRYFTGRHHAAEVLRKLLQHRLPGSPTVNKVTDAASKNFSLDEESKKKLEEGACNVHAFLLWHDHQYKFPAEYAIVGEGYHNVYLAEETAMARKMSPEERLAYHQLHSRPWMEKIRALCFEIAADRRAEPRTPLYEAVHFFLNQWPRLTKFLEVPGMPLDTNLCEQTLIAIVRYLASCFNYHTEKGAEVGDGGMSLVATARANDVEPWTWLADCLKNHIDLAKNPEQWFPWAWKERMAAAKQGAPPKPPDGVHQMVV